MKIEKNYTVISGLTYAMVLLIIVLIASPALVLRSQTDNKLPLSLGLIAFGLFYVWWVALVLLRNRQLGHRTNELREIAALRGLEFTSENIGLTTAFSWMSLRNMRKAKNARSYNVIAGHDWTYSDFSYEIHHHTKSGSYRAVTNYYSVMTMQLPRSLPNVFFDSIQQRHRQFRFHFAKSQLHRLEGDFDEHFATYFPPQYTLDSMSFITPEVMWALREARDYDIEIVGDRVFLYGSLKDANTQLDDMYTKLANIKQKLLNNVMTYRDERLPAEVGRKQVTPIAMELRRSTFWKYVTLAIVIFYLLVHLFPWLVSLVTNFSN